MNTIVFEFTPEEIMALMQKKVLSETKVIGKNKKIRYEFRLKDDE